MRFISLEEIYKKAHAPNFRKKSREGSIFSIFQGAAPYQHPSLGISVYTEYFANTKH
jgi:hypothetical protein